MDKTRTPVDPDGLMEFSVVFTDRSLNSMSKLFQKVMTDISSMLKEVYNADKVAIVPGGGTYAMEAVARQFGAKANVFVVRNGWFSRFHCEHDGDEGASVGQREPRALRACADRGCHCSDPRRKA